MTDERKCMLSVVCMFIIFLIILLLIINKLSFIDGVYILLTIFLMCRYCYIKKME